MINKCDQPLDRRIKSYTDCTGLLIIVTTLMSEKQVKQTDRQTIALQLPLANVQGQHNK